MRIEESPTWTGKIYISGPIEVAKQLIRRDALRRGFTLMVRNDQVRLTGGRGRPPSAALVAEIRAHSEAIAKVLGQG